MKLLPVALNVQGKRCLVVGGGSVAQRKASSLLSCGANVTVIAPILSEGFTSIEGNIEHQPCVYQIGDCQGYHLVFACTDKAEVNAAVAHESWELGIWCNVADDAESSDFHSAAAIERGDICIGITTQGSSPLLARHLKARVEACIGPEYEQLLTIMGTRRVEVKEKIASQEERAALWRSILASPVLRLLRDGRFAEAETLVDKLINSSSPTH